jgi:hypothetical protein
MTGSEAAGMEYERGERAMIRKTFNISIDTIKRPALFAAGAALALTLAAGTTATPAGAAEFWPVLCQGPLPQMRLVQGSLIMTARAGVIANNPRPGECVWLDRPMTRPGERRGDGTAVFVLRGAFRPALINDRGTIRWQMGGDARAVRIWRRNAAGRRFRFAARRVGHGRYDARFRPTAWPGGFGPGGGMGPGGAAGWPRAVRVTITRIRVIRDGDRVSPGDWIVRLAAGPAGRPGATRYARWPGGGGSRNVRDGRTYNLNLSTTVPMMPGEALRVGILATDCDGSPLLDLGATLPGELGDLFRSLGAGRSAACPGEELIELSGPNDNAGTMLLFGAPRWRYGTTFTHRVRHDEVEYIVRGRITPIW